MINKQNLWFITLFSLILVLGIYYFSFDKEDSKLLYESEEKIESAIYESDALLALRVAEDENILEQIENCQETILNVASTLDEKNEAYDNLQALSKQKGKAEEIEKLIMDKMNMKSFIKFDNDQINVTISTDNHSKELANKIIREIQALYKEQMYITVKFE